MQNTMKMANTQIHSSRSSSSRAPRCFQHATIRPNRGKASRPALKNQLPPRLQTLSPLHNNPLSQEPPLLAIFPTFSPITNSRQMAAGSGSNTNHRENMPRDSRAIQMMPGSEFRTKAPTRHPRTCRCHQDSPTPMGSSWAKLLVKSAMPASIRPGSWGKGSANQRIAVSTTAW